MVVDEWIENILAQIKLQGYAEILDKNRKCIIKCISPEEYDSLIKAKLYNSDDSLDCLRFVSPSAKLVP